jgi:MFS family permease
VHRVTGASGAGRTGLSTLIELTAAGGAGDAFVAVSLAGTIFFSTSVDQARGRVVLFLLVTMAPFAVLAPFIGPALDRMQQGRKFLLAGTLLARGLLCWGMSAAIDSPVTLLPAAFGILVLQKAYGVARASVTPRLLPAEITLVTANARSQLITLTASILGGAVAAGIQATAGSAWVLRTGTLIYLAAMVLALRLPDQVDVPPTPAAPVPPSPPPDEYPNENGRYASGRGGDAWAGQPGRDGRTLPYEPGALPPGTRAPGTPAPGAPAGADSQAAGSRNGRTTGGRRWRTLANVGPIVGEAMRGNAVLRAFSGYMVFFLAFYLRSAHFSVSHNAALGALVAAAAAGGLAAMAVGSLLRARAPAFILFAMLTLAPIVTATCAWFFSLTSVIAVAFTAALAAGLAKLALDSTVQREIGEEIRSSAFAVSETLNQVANVAGSLAGVLVSILDNGEAGLTIAAAFLTLALVTLVARRRRRILGARAEAEAAYAQAPTAPRRPRPRAG